MESEHQAVVTRNEAGNSVEEFSFEPREVKDHEKVTVYPKVTSTMMRRQLCNINETLA